MTGAFIAIIYGSIGLLLGGLHLAVCDGCCRRYAGIGGRALFLVLSFLFMLPLTLYAMLGIVFCPCEDD